jgi:dihydrofolate reductase
MTSLDGFIETPDHSLDWATVDEELHRFSNEQERESSLDLYGRRLYEVMTYWQTADADPAISDYEAEFAHVWQATPKIVFSRTLDRVEGDSRLVRGDAAETIARLKAETDGVLTIGGPTLAATAARLDLIDEYQPIVHPVVLGAGTRFLPDGLERRTLRLVETRTFGSGVVFLRYVRATADPSVASP